MGALVAIAAAGVAVSAGSAIASGTSSGTAGGAGQAGGTYGGSPSTYIPTNQAGADANLSTIENNLYSQDQSIQGLLSSDYYNVANSTMQNPYYQQAQGSSNQIAGLGVPVANAAFQGAQNLQAMGNAESPYAAQILQTGFDPQNALYNRTQQQLTDQVNAQNAMSGLSGSPYGAGVANQAASNFNIDWQNQQEARQAQALSAYGGAITSTGAAYSGAQGLADQGLNTLQTTGQLPYNTYNQIGQNQFGALNSLAAGYTAAQQPTNNLINQYNSYLGLGQSATGQALQGQQQGFNQGQQVGQNIGQGLAGLSQSAGGLINAWNSNNNNVNSSAGYTSAINNAQNPYANPADYSPAFGY
jgi:hypothetical protein